MKLPNNGGDRDPTLYPLLPNDTSSIKIRLHLIELLAKGGPVGTPKQSRLLPRL